VESEFFVAGGVELGDSQLSAVVTTAAAQSVGRTLSWLLGWERQPPVELPRRPVPTAEQLYDQAVRDDEAIRCAPGRIRTCDTRFRRDLVFALMAVDQRFGGR
jgi:hypothetical protein